MFRFFEVELKLEDLSKAVEIPIGGPHLPQSQTALV
jgi:hypothetical protein